MAEQRLTRQALTTTADCERHCHDILAEVHREAPDERGQLGVNARPEVLMRLIETAIGTVTRPIVFPVVVMLSTSLALAFFQSFRLSIEGAYNGHVEWEPLVGLLDRFLLEQFLPIADRPLMSEEIARHDQVLRDIQSIRANHPWFHLPWYLPPPAPPVEEEAGAGEEVVEEEGGSPSKVRWSPAVTS